MREINEREIAFAELGTITALRERSVEASLGELRERDRMTLALRSALRQGIDINDLSEASGLTVQEIERRVGADLVVLSDLEALAGAA